MLRRIFLIDGYVMIVLGFLLGVPSVVDGHERDNRILGLDRPGPVVFVPFPPRFWPKVYVPLGLQFGTFGLTFLCYGFASLVVGRSGDSAFQRKAALYALAGHLLFALMVGLRVKGRVLWFIGTDFILFDLLVWPIPALLYGLMSYPSVGLRKVSEMPSTEKEIREAAGQEERNRLAQDLHDSVKQQIYSVQTNLATAEARWNNDAAGARSAIEHARSAARDAMTEMSALLDRLRRDPIESVGLVEALRRQCEALRFQTAAAVSTSFGDLPHASFLPPGAMTSVFRIAQEAFANIARHARAKHVALQLDTSREKNALFLEIRDDGCGFDAESSSAGMGLRNMRVRAEEIGAELKIQSAAGNGSVVRLWVSLIDVKAERAKHQVLRLAAALIPAIAAASLMILWEGSAPYVLPFVILGGGLAAFHLSALMRLRSA
jgi:signal transduction histidine kinase